MRYGVEVALPKGEVPTPVVIRVTDFEGDDVEKFSEAMDKAHTTGQPVVPVVIDTDGGNAYDLISMVSIIRASRVPVVTIVEGRAMSAGAILFAFGRERFMAEDAVLMVHDIRSSPEGKTSEVKADAEEMERLTAQLFSEMDRACGHEVGYFERMLDERKHGEWYLPAKEAKKHGFIKTIGLPTFTVQVAATHVCTGPDGRPLLTDPAVGGDLRVTRRTTRHAEPSHRGSLHKRGTTTSKTPN